MTFITRLFRRRPDIAALHDARQKALESHLRAYNAGDTRALHSARNAVYAATHRLMAAQLGRK